MGYLYLSGNELSGTLPVELGQLTNLDYLNLSDNELSGSLPVELGQGTNLNSLDLSNNQLVGSIPPELINNRYLTSLQLNDNDLSGCFTNEIDDFCTRIIFGDRNYDFSNNPKLPWQGALGGLCSGLSQIGAVCNNQNGNDFRDVINDNCECVDCVDQIYEVQAYICEGDEYIFANEVLNTTGVYTKTLASTLGCDSTVVLNLTIVADEDIGTNCNDGNETTINDTLLSDCSCVGMPLTADCRYRDSLILVELIYLSDDYLPWDVERPISEWAGVELNDEGCVHKLSNVYDGDDDDGGSGGHLCDFFDFVSEVIKEENPLPIPSWNRVMKWGRQLPNSLGEFHALKSLHIIYNRLDTLPEWIYNLTELESLVIERSAVSGKLSPQIKQLQKLKVLYLGNNNLQSNVPEEIGSLLNLEQLDLSSNQLENIESSSIANLTNLEVLNLSNNKLNTSLAPDIFTNLKNLEYLNFSDNQLSGNIPSICSNRLEYFDFSNNQFTGSFSHLNISSSQDSIRKILIHNNSITGKLPVLDNYFELTDLVMAYNQFEGEIPDYSSLSKLEFCLLNDNRLSDMSASITPFSSALGFQVYNNALTFEDIIFTDDTINTTITRNGGNGRFSCFENYNYSNQALIYKDTTLIVYPNEALEIDLDMDATIMSNQYVWYKDNIAYDTIIGENKLDFDNCQITDEGIYHVKVTNPNANELRLYSHPIRIKPYGLNVSDTLLCETQQLGLNIEVIGGLAPYSYTWREIGNPDNTKMGNIFEGEIIDTVPNEGEYIITIIDSDTIATTIIDTVKVWNLPLSSTMPNSNECEDNTLITATLPDGTTGYWSGNGIIEPEIEESTAQLDYGDNVFIWSLSKDECIDYSSDTLLVFREGYPITTDDAYCLSISQSPLELSLIANDDPSACSDYEITFSEPTIATRMTEVSKGVYHFQAQQPNEILEFEYTICNTVCPDFCATASVYLEIVPTIGNILEQPVGITPNGDGLNDMFIIKDLEINSYPQQELRIFNQWGQVIFEAETYQNNWDGRNLNGQPVTEGTYYFLLRLGNGYEDRVGRILLLR